MFYDEFCKLANQAGKSPSACAVEMGFQKSSVTRWKQGMIPRRANLLKIADFFGVDVADLVKEDEKNGQAQSLSDVQQRLICEIPNLDDDTVATLLILAKQLKGRAQSPGSPQST